MDLYKDNKIYCYYLPNYHCNCPVLIIPSETTYNESLYFIDFVYKSLNGLIE